VDEGAGDEDAALFSGGHGGYGLMGEAGGVYSLEGLVGAVAHLFCHDEVGPEGGGGEEAGDDGFKAGGAGKESGFAGLCGAEGERFRDDAEVFAELGEVPAGAAEDHYFWPGLGGAGEVGIRKTGCGGLDGVELAVHGADEGGFAAAVGAEDDEVFAGLDGEVDVMEDDAVTGGDGDVAEVEEGWFWGLGGGWRGNGLRAHLC